MALHPRISLHQVALIKEDAASFIRFCGEIGVAWATVVTATVATPDQLAAAEQALSDTGVRVQGLNHPFALFPDLERDEGEASRRLLEALPLASRLGARSIYMQTGGRGALSWEAAAERFAALLGPARAAARERGISLMIENASPFNIDIHIAHTLADTVLLAEIAGIDVCVDLQPCWGEAGLPGLFRRALPRTHLVQVSDYVLGDRVAPCRAVPGDGAVPLERLIGDLLAAGYEGLFDLELVGPRIDQEGPRLAARRAAERLSEMLERLGA
jgi:sugar phosphate isomerase/epimerase